MTSSTHDQSKTLAQLYVEAVAANLEVNIESAELQLKMTKKRIARAAEDASADKELESNLDGYTAEYRVARILAPRLRDIHKFLLEGRLSDSEKVLEAEQRIENLRKWFEQESRAALEMLARGDTSGWGWPQRRAEAAALLAVQEASRYAINDLIRTEIAAEWDDLGHPGDQLKGAKAKLFDFQQSLLRAKKPERVAELQAEVEKWEGLVAHAQRNFDIAHGAAQDRVLNGIRGGIVRGVS